MRMTSGVTPPRPPPPAPGAPAVPALPTREEVVRECLRAVIDPELGDTIVDLGMVRAIAVAGSSVVVDVALTIAACPLRSQIERDVRGQLEALEWVESVEIRIATMDAAERAPVMARARWRRRAGPAWSGSSPWGSWPTRSRPSCGVA